MNCKRGAVLDQAVVDNRKTELKSVNMETRVMNNLVSSHGMKVTEVVTDTSPQITSRMSKWIFPLKCSQMFIVVCRTQLYAFPFHYSHNVYIMVIPLFLLLSLNKFEDHIVRLSE